MTVAILIRRAQSRPGQHDEEQILGPCERGALGIGLALAAQRDAPAVAIAVGPARREDRVLAMALRAGCARAVRVWDDGLDDVDYLGLAEVLAAAIRSVNATLVVCGDRSVDERAGAIGPAVAELLGIAHITGVGHAKMIDGALGVEHLSDHGPIQLRFPGPLLLAVTAPSARNRDDTAAPPPAASQSIAVKELADLGLDPRRLAPRRALVGRLRPLRGARQAILLADAAALVDRLRSERLLPTAIAAPTIDTAIETPTIDTALETPTAIATATPAPAPAEEPTP